MKKSLVYGLDCSILMNRYLKKQRNTCINCILFFIFLSIFTANNVYAALSATTAKTIQGSRPFVKLNGTPIPSINKLLNFTLPDGTVVEPTITGPAHVLPTNTFNQVTALIAADNAEHSLATMPSISYGDNDIDGPSLTAPITGTLKATWSYKLADGTTKVLTAAELTNTFVACDAPYTLTISANNVKAQSAYGDPIDKDYGSLSKSYTVNVADYKICFAKPNS